MLAHTVQLAGAPLKGAGFTTDRSLRQEFPAKIFSGGSSKCRGFDRAAQVTRTIGTDGRADDASVGAEYERADSTRRESCRS
jgi:hypothetical protein